MKNFLKYFIILVLIPAVIYAGIAIFESKRYAFVSLTVCILACIPFFLSFEKKADSKKMIIIAVMIALSVAGRIVFAMIPGFKPVTAIVIITALYFGSEAGFLTGALTAVISNFYFGQGAWTPLQMAVWGLLGFLAGLLAKFLLNHTFALLIYGAFAGVVFSLLTDIWTVVWMDNTFNLSRYLAAVATSLPFMGIYAASNILFLLLLTKPLGSVLKRVNQKYGLEA